MSDKPGAKMEELQAAYITSSIDHGDREELPDATNKQLTEKMEDIKKEIMTMPKDPDLFKNHQLPLARIKKIMKSDEDVRVRHSTTQMISSETPVLFAKACEIFIIELTHRAWHHTEQAKRRTLQKSDIAACIESTQIFDFLIDIIPKEDLKTKKPETPAMHTFPMGYPKGLEPTLHNSPTKFK